MSNQASGAVVYSFNGRWIDALRKNSVRVFFRKRRPVRLPGRVFLYIGVPVKAIIGIATVTDINRVDLAQAIEISKDGSITHDELHKYIGVGSVYAIHIRDVEIFDPYVKLSSIQDRYGFNPPQSFSYVGSELGQYLMKAKQ